MNNNKICRFALVSSINKGALSAIFLFSQFIFLMMGVISLIYSLTLWAEMKVFSIIGIVCLVIYSRIHKRAISYNPIPESFIDFYSDKIEILANKKSVIFNLHDITDIVINYNKFSTKNPASNIQWKFEKKTFLFEFPILNEEDKEKLLSVLKSWYSQGIEIEETIKRTKTYLLSYNVPDLKTSKYDNLIEQIGKEKT
jgi:hypothetical protein